MKNDQEETPAGSNDQFVRRMIPTVTAVGLTLGAGACGDSGPELSKDDLRDYCSDLRSCVGDDDFGWASVDECASYFDEYIAYYTDVSRSDIDQACADASLEFFKCAIDNAACDMGQFYYEESDCESEYYAQYDACYDGMSM